MGEKNVRREGGREEGRKRKERSSVFFLQTYSFNS
jgi:hypothetical protein